MTSHLSFTFQQLEVYKEFKRNADILEKSYLDMQDIEFSVQEGKLFMLQTRNGKRCGEAAVKIAVDLVDEGLVDQNNALLKVLDRKSVV